MIKLFLSSPAIIIIIRRIISFEYSMPPVLSLRAGWMAGIASVAVLPDGVAIPPQLCFCSIGENAAGEYEMLLLCCSL